MRYKKPLCTPNINIIIVKDDTKNKSRGYYKNEGKSLLCGGLWRSANKERS